MLRSITIYLTFVFCTASIFVFDVLATGYQVTDKEHRLVAISLCHGIIEPQAAKMNPIIGLAPDEEDCDDTPPPPDPDKRSKQMVGFSTTPLVSLKQFQYAAAHPLAARPSPLMA